MCLWNYALCDLPHLVRCAVEVVRHCCAGALRPSHSAPAHSSRTAFQPTRAGASRTLQSCAPPPRRRGSEQALKALLIGACLDCGMTHHGHYSIQTCWTLGVRPVRRSSVSQVYGLGGQGRHCSGPSSAAHPSLLQNIGASCVRCPCSQREPSTEALTRRCLPPARSRPSGAGLRTCSQELLVTG